MTSKVSIISDAYFQLGKDPISTLNPQSSLDVGASAIYDRVIPSVITSFNYPFSRKFKALNKNATDPSDEYFSSSFALPHDLLALISFAKSTHDFEYKIIGSDLWTNESSVSIWYRYEPPTSLFPPQFTLYLTYLMCAHLAYPITNKSDLLVYWEKKSNEYRAIAASTLKNQEPNDVMQDSPFDTAFRGSGSSRSYI